MQYVENNNANRDFAYWIGISVSIIARISDRLFFLKKDFTIILNRFE